MPMMNRDSDRFHVAKNLGRMLEEMEVKGHRKTALLGKLGMGQPDGSTKVLYNYTLPADAELEHVAGRVRKLTKKAGKYLPLAKEAAAQLNEPCELAVLKLFQNTSYEVLEEIADEQFAYLREISEILLGIGSAAIKRSDLNAYLEILNSQKIGWDISGAFGRFASIPDTVSLQDRAARHVSYLGYIPTVFLYRQDVEPAQPIEGEAFPPIRFFRNASPICSSALSVVLPSKSGGTTPTSAIRRKAGRRRAGWWRKSNGIRASFIQRSDLS